jgi:V/A-type H+-transporting ATPase subunit C
VARLDEVNARVAARRGRLLGAETLRELAALPDLAARAARLRAAAAGARVPPPSPAAPDLAAVEAALREGVRRESAFLLARAEGRAARAALAAVVELDAAEAVKVCLRGVAAGAAPADVLAAAPPTPALPEPALATLAAAPSLAALAARLVAWVEGPGRPSVLAGALAGALARHPGGGLLPLEAAVDAAAFTEARAAARGPGEDRRALAAHLADRADARNAAVLLLAGDTLPAEEVFADGGGRLARVRLAGLAGAGPAARRAAAAAAFPEAADALADPFRADRAREEAVLARARRRARAAPHSVAVPIAHLLARRAEVRRVALVLRGAGAGLDPASVLALAGA